MRFNNTNVSSEVRESPIVNAVEQTLKQDPFFNMNERVASEGSKLDSVSKYSHINASRGKDVKSKFLVNGYVVLN